MNPFEFVLILVCILTVAGLIKNRQKAAAGQGSAEFRAQLHRLDDLEHRVQVLEKIVTDRNYDLKRQFEDLERG